MRSFRPVRTVFGAPLTILELAAQLSNGELKNEVRLTVLEGWTSQEIAAAVERTGLMSATHLVAARVHDSRDSSSAILPILLVARQVQRWKDFFSDTYFGSNASARHCGKMLDNFDTKPPNLREAIKRNNRSPLKPSRLRRLPKKFVQIVTVRSWLIYSYVV